MIDVAIRCCCRPDKLIGHVTLDREPAVGQRLRFPLMPVWAPSKLVLRAEQVELVAQEWWCDAGGEKMLGGIAFKADGHDIDDLKRIRGFRAA